MYRKTLRQRKKKAKREQCAKMRAAKERKRQQEAERMQVVGGFKTWGCLGEHDVQLLAYPEDTTAVAIMVDGKHRKPRTLNGVVRCLGQMLWQKMQR